MKAAISFTIYKDFNQFIIMENNKFPDYSKALEILNDIVKELIDKKELVFQYGKKPVGIIFPISLDDCGNIFSKEDYMGECWNGVDIWCNIPNVKPEKFDSDKLLVKRCPSYFSPELIFY